MDITDIRRARLKAWFAKSTLPANEKSYLSQLIGGKASFGEKAARRLEKTYGMPPMHLDTPLDAVPAPTGENHSELLGIWEWLLPGEKQAELERIRPMAARNKEAATHFQRVVRVTDQRKRQVNFTNQEERRKKEDEQ